MQWRYKYSQFMIFVGPTNLHYSLNTYVDIWQEDYRAEEELTPSRKYLKLELSTTARMMERVGVGAQCAAKLLTAFCKDLELMDENQPVIVTEKKLRGETDRAGAKSYEKIKSLKICGM